MKKIIAIGIFVPVLLIGFLVFMPNLDPLGLLENTNETYTTCERHYALITSGENDDFWKRVYESARKEGMANNACVELFGNALSVDYSRNELLAIARRTSVDGIIVEADETVETQRLIDTIVNAGIPVVTAMKDCSASIRQSYVGINNYDAGVLYGQKIAELLAGKREAKVLVVAKGEASGVSENLILLGIRETLAAELPECAVQVDSETISQTSSFAEEEYYNALFMRENLPDVLICQNVVGTICAYQSAVDHNQVGSVAIIGFYDSDTILSAVEKNVLTATLSIDAEQMGAACVDALEDYYTYGHTSGYQAVKMEIIDSAKAAELLVKEVSEP